MARVSAEKVLHTSKGETKFILRQMDGMLALKLFARLSKALGGALANLATTKGDKLGAIVGLLGSVDSEQIDAICGAVFPGCIAITGGDVDNNAQSNLGTLFTGEVGQLIQLIAHALMLNYEKAFHDLLALGNSAGQAPKV